MRLIDADVANACEIPVNFDYIEPADIQEWIDKQPTIDPVHAAGVCYCRECAKFSRYTQNNRNFGICQRHNSEVGENDFCSYGVRREGDRNGDH